MNKNEYQKLVSKLTPKEDKFKNYVISFLVGGLVGFINELLVIIISILFNLERINTYPITTLIIIFIACLFTSLGFFDKWVSFSKAGLFLPTTGFAHSCISSGLDYKKDGMITGIGGNFFKLAGSVILYGIVSAFFFALLGGIIYE